MESKTGRRRQSRCMAVCKGGLPDCWGKIAPETKHRLKAFAERSYGKESVSAAAHVAKSVLVREVAEAGKAIVEEELDLVRRAVTVLLHQHFRAAMRPLHLFHPQIGRASC